LVLGDTHQERTRRFDDGGPVGDGVHRPNVCRETQTDQPRRRQCFARHL